MTVRVTSRSDGVKYLSKGKLILIDGNSLANRAYYALPGLATAEGQPTSAVYGFLTMLFKILDEEQPDHLAVAFDKSAPTFRHREFSAYKAHRTGMPDDLRAQFPLLKEVLRALNLSMLEIEGYEADDVLGTVSLQAEKQGCRTLIFTGDRDALQLVSDQTGVILTRKGISEIARYDETAIREQYGLSPEQIIDVKGLMGDVSDNIPGIPGVGEKTALKLIQEFGSVEGVLENLDKLPGKKLSETVAANAEQAILSKKLATIKRDVPLEFDFEETRVREPDFPRAYELFKKLEFKTLLKRVEGGKGAAPESGGFAWDQKEYRFIDGAEPGVEKELRRVLEALRGPTAWVYRETAGKPRSTASGSAAPGPALAAFSPGAGRAYLCEVDAEAAETLAVYWGDRSLCKVAHDAKPLLVRLMSDAAGGKRDSEGNPDAADNPDAASWRPAGFEFDTAVAAYLLDPTRSAYRIEALAREYGLADLPGPEEAPSRSDYLCALADLTGRLRGHLEKRLKAEEGWELFTEIEMPLIEVLAEMEHVGVGVDRAGLNVMAVELEERISELTRRIYELAGEEFNVNSTRQLGEILFVKLKLPVIKTTKTGFSTDADVLEALSGKHEIIERILEHRQLVKLKGTYVDGLRALINPKTGRVHTTFNQTVTATGRLSSQDPNLQNIPIRLEEGRRIRKVFVPRPGWLLFTCDYSQIELRVLAHIAGDEALRDAFLQGQDIHTRTASEVFGAPMEKVTKEMRSAAKAVNFGIVYGISDFGLARNLGVPRAEAKDYIDGYLARYPGVKAYMEGVVKDAREKGYVCTLCRRRRPIPDINNRNRTIRQAAERTAINTPIQGTAADIIKVAMINVHREIKERRLKARMLLQVHDELVFEVPPTELGELKTLVVDLMENSVKLTVPLKVDAKVGPNWYDMEKA